MSRESVTRGTTVSTLRALPPQAESGRYSDRVA
jgi:hypothetical protein